MRYVLRAVVIVALAGLGTTLMVDAGQPTHLYADEVVREPARWSGETVSVQGIVQPGSRQRVDSPDGWRFTVGARGAVLNVRYTGAVPATFVDGSEVVVVGELDTTGFRASRVLVRVPG